MSRSRLSFIRSLIPTLSLVALFAGGFANAAHAANSAKIASPGKMQEKAYAQLLKVKAGAHKNVSNRLTALETLSTRIRSIRSLTDAERSNILAEIRSSVASLGALKDKIDSETDAASIAADMAEASSTLKNSQIVSQASLEASSDRASKVISLMANLGVKLQKRLAALKAKGSDISALEASLSDFNAKIADAKSQITAARAETDALNFNNARAGIGSATDDLQAARAEVSVIIHGIRKR